MLKVTFVSGEVQYYQRMEKTPRPGIMGCIRDDAGLARLCTTDEIESVTEVSEIEAAASLGPNPVRQP